MTASTRRLARSVVLLGTVWLVMPASSPPLYDGIGFPDEPYRYVHPPAGYRTTKPPTGIDRAVKVSQSGRVSGFYATSDEVGPQVALYMREAGISLPAGATQLTLAVTPLAESRRDAASRVRGNVYRVSLTTDAGPAGLLPIGQRGVEIRLRSPDAPSAEPVLGRLTDGQWRALPTTRYGRDIWGGPIGASGDYALLRAAHPGGRPDSSGRSPIVWVLALAAGFTAVVLVLVRIRAAGDPASRG